MSLPAGQVANAASSSASSSSSSHRPQPAKLDDVAARLTDGKLGELGEHLETLMIHTDSWSTLTQTFQNDYRPLTSCENAQSIIRRTTISDSSSSLFQHSFLHSHPCNPVSSLMLQST